MVYRIRYRKQNAPDEGETVVEANSPAEAVVKFRHAWEGNAASVKSDVVTSVQPDEAVAGFRP